MNLLDTNVVSELRKLTSHRTDPIFVGWAKQADIHQSYLSVITIQELEIGYLRLERRDRQQASLLREWFEHYVLKEFADRILPLDLAQIRRSNHLHGSGTRTVRDTFIAATAFVHDLAVVTRNVADFEDTGVRVINPWQLSP